MNETETLPSVLTDRDIKTLVCALSWSRGEAGFHEDEAARVIEEVKATFIMADLYRVVLAGKAACDVGADGQVSVVALEHVAGSPRDYEAYLSGALAGTPPGGPAVY